jgi:aspartate aminotransferase
VAYTREELAELVEIALDAGVTIVSDEIYAKLIYDDFPHCSVPSLSPRARENTVLVGGFSKTYAMTGWRVGYAAGPREIIGAMDVIQSHTTSNACSISQAAAREALDGSQDSIPALVGEFARRRDLVLSLLGKIPGWTCVRPRGAFYVFPNVASTFGRTHGAGVISGSTALAEYLIETAHVAVVPGEGFGAPDHLRFSYAASAERLTVGLTRVAEAIQALSR